MNALRQAAATMGALAVVSIYLWLCLWHGHDGGDLWY